MSKMAESPVTYREYYGRWFAAFRHDLLRLGKDHAIGAVLAVAILGLQLKFGVIQSAVAREAWASIFWPYGLLVAGLIVTSAIRAPVKVDRDRAGSIVDLEGKVEESGKDIVRLKSEITGLTKPKRNAFEEANYQRYAAILRAYGDDEKAVIRQLRNYGKIRDHDFLGMQSSPRGLSRDRTTEILMRLTSDEVVHRELSQINPAAIEKTFTIVPAASDAVEDWLSGN